MLKASIACAAVSLAVLTASACGGSTSDDEPAQKEISAKDFDPQNFSRSTTVDNRWFPLRPGTQLVYEGSTIEDGERIPRRVVFTVTDLVKEIHGVRNVVVWDRDWKDGVLEEAELSLFAQDDDGNVWHLGEYPEEYDEGKVVATPAWFHGIKGAKAGITMKASPRVGAPSYSQGFAPPPVNWVDRGQVHRMGAKTCAPARCFQDVLVVREFEPDKPGAAQLKYYAPGTGNIRVGWLGEKDQDKEELALVSIVRLGPSALAKARNDAMALEKRGYRINKAVYGRTPPSTRLGS